MRCDLTCASLIQHTLSLQTIIYAFALFRQRACLVRPQAHLARATANPGCLARQQLRPGIAYQFAVEGWI
jgi:hypothetical protein